MNSIKGMGATMLLVFWTTAGFSIQEPSVLLEKAIYAEETLGNLNDAITIYQQIINTADTSRSTAALALYRLGMCYRKGGRENDALAAFADLARLYPEQKDLIAKCRMLDLRPAPWIDGEVLRMGTKSSGAKGYMGSVVYSAESAQEAGREAWHLRYVMVSTGTWVYQTAVVDADSYFPISSRIRINFMRSGTEATYAPDQVEVTSSQNGVKTKKQIALTGAAYDFGQILYLLRCLPLREGFEATIPVFNPAAGSAGNLKVSVVGLETITVPAGTFECYKTVMTPETNAQEQSIWFSADGHLYPVKTIQGGVMEQDLSSIEVVGKNQPVRFEDDELGISMSMPSHWYFGSTALGNLVSLAAPELDSILLLYCWEYKPEDGSVTDNLDKWIKRHKEQTQIYQVRPDTRETVTIGGFTGERYAADTNHVSTGEAMVEYTFSFITPQKRYILVFQTNKDQFDKMKPECESIISSLGVQ